MEKSNSLILTNIYFGKPPGYFDLFLESCVRNPNIDFLFITDFPDISEIATNAPNIKFVRMSFDQFRGKVASFFDFDIALSSPYKICDYRPAFGEVLSDYFNGYAYWGHCDFDMIFGNLDKVLSTLADVQPDKLYRRGHLTAYRNCETVNSFYRSEAAKGRYRAVFSTDDFSIFDETNGIDALFRESGMHVVHEELIYDVAPNSPYLRKSTSKVGIGQYCLLTDTGLSAYNFFSRAGRSFIYIHLQKRKPSQGGKRDAQSILYLDQFGFIWTHQDCLWFVCLRSLVPNLGHVWQRIQRGVRKFVK